jgi:hypothetical protein
LWSCKHADTISLPLAVAVDQTNHRKVQQAAARVPADLLFALVALADADDHAVVDVQVGNLDGALQQAARIETQIEDEALDAAFGQIVHDLMQVLGTIAGELGEADVTDLVGRIDHVIPAIVSLTLEAED